MIMWLCFFLGMPCSGADVKHVSSVKVVASSGAHLSRLDNMYDQQKSLRLKELSTMYHMKMIRMMWQGLHDAVSDLCTKIVHSDLTKKRVSGLVACASCEACAIVTGVKLKMLTQSIACLYDYLELLQQHKALSARAVEDIQSVVQCNIVQNFSQIGIPGEEYSNYGFGPTLSIAEGMDLCKKRVRKYYKKYLFRVSASA